MNTKKKPISYLASDIIHERVIPEITVNIVSGYGDWTKNGALCALYENGFAFATAETYHEETDTTLFDGFRVINDTPMDNAWVESVLCRLFFPEPK